MQRLSSYLLIVLMSLSVVIPAAMPFYEECCSQFAGALSEDMAEEGLLEIEKEAYIYSPVELIGRFEERVLRISFVFACDTHPESQFLPGLVDIPPEFS